MDESIFPHYRAFMSYSHANSSWARWLHSAVEGFKPSADLIGRKTRMGQVPRSLHPIFRDRDEFPAGRPLKAQTLAALDASAALIVLCSPSAAQSHYVNEEVALFKHRQPDRPIIPVILEGTPGSPDLECFPPALKFRIGPQGQITNKPDELLAADVRKSGDGEDLALAKVIACLIDVPVDDIRKRVEIRWRRRATLHTLTMVSLVALTIVGGYLYWQSQKLSKIEAIVQTLVVSSSAQAAPGTEKAVGDAVTAATRGAEAGDERMQKALELLKAGKPDEAEPLFRAVAEQDGAGDKRGNTERAAAYRNLGAIARLSDPGRAREAYEKALKLDPDDPDTLYWLGLLQLWAGDLPAAEQYLTRLKTLSERYDSDRGLYRAHLRLGELMMERRLWNEAREHEDQALAIVRRQIAARPRDPEWQRELSVVLNKVGDVHVGQKNNTDALKAYREALTTIEGLAGSDSSNLAWQYDLGISNERIGDVLNMQGDLPNALSAYNTELSIMSRLTTAQPNNATWLRNLAVSYSKVGDIMSQKSDLPQALEKFRASDEAFARLVELDLKNPSWKADLAGSHGRLGQIYAKMKRRQEALECFRKGRAIVAPLAAERPDVALWQEYVAEFDRDIATLERE